MVGTGANRMPLTKVHPILLGQQKGLSGGGGSLLSQARQKHNERKNQQQSPGGGGSGPPPNPPNQQFQQYQQNNQFGQNNQNRPPPQFNKQQFNNQQYGGFPQHNFNNNQPPPPPPSNNQPAPPPPPSSNDNKPPPPPSSGVETTERKKRKRPSRWGAEEERANMNGLVTLPADLTEDQRKHYLIQFKIEEISQKLRTNELGIPADPLARSPSPEPIYNAEGKRLNTREYRVRKNLEEERLNLIKKAIEDIPNYKPPLDYKTPLARIQDKVFIPADKNPAVNFIGLLIGPRGNTLRRLEKETGCKIIIRGKGSVKEGKVGRIPGQLMPGEDEPLHALITGPTEDEVKKGKEVVAAIVKEGVECPDAANELRRNQLRELAELNGTLIDEEIIKCKNCGATDHKHWECQEQRNVTAQITCQNCGGYGHVAQDCKVKNDSGPMQTFAEKAKMDTEYMSLMAELGVEGPAKTDAPKLPDPSKEKSSKWGPPANSAGPPQHNNPRPRFNNNQFNRAPPQNQPPPWAQNRHGGPRNQRPPFNNGGGAPWQQGPPQNYRGPPPNNYNMPPPGYNAGPPQMTGYPRQMGGWQPPPQQQGYGGYQPPPPQQQTYQPPPPPANYQAPWNQPPPPPPPPSS